MPNCGSRLAAAVFEGLRRDTRSNPIDAGVQPDETEEPEAPLPPPPDSNVWSYPVTGASIPGLVFVLIALAVMTAAFLDWKVRAAAKSSLTLR